MHESQFTYKTEKSENEKYPADPPQQTMYQTAENGAGSARFLGYNTNG